MKVSEAQLGLIGAQEERWPAADVSIAWRQMHEAMSAIRQWGDVFLNVLDTVVDRKPDDLLQSILGGTS